MAREHVERDVELRGAGAGDAAPEELLGAEIVPPRIEARELAGSEVEAPAREDARERLDVALRVAAVDAERVQLHQLARVVLVEAAGAVARVVEVDEHRRMARGGADEVAKAAERLRPHRALLVVGDQRAQRALELEHAEVVHPEPGHLLLELVRRIERAQEHPRLRLAPEPPEALL